MTKPLNLNNQVQTLLSKYGQKGLETAKAATHDKNMPKPIQEILEYFIEETWPNTHHPALTSLCCEAVGGSADATHRIGAAVVLLTGAADIHDDIIDKSRTKSRKQTAYDKFDKDLVLLAGDALLFKGLVFLHQACEEFPTEKQRAIFNAMTDAFFKIGNAATRERWFRAKRELNPEEYCRIIGAKGAVSEACAEIGAIMGNGKTEEINILRNFGRTLGFLMTIRNEFTDMRDPNELENRMKNEVLPLPLLYALQDPSANVKLISLLQGRIKKQIVKRIDELVLETERVQKLEAEMLLTKEREEKLLNTLNGNMEPFKLLLDVSTDYLCQKTVLQEMFPTISRRALIVSQVT